MRAGVLFFCMAMAGGSALAQQRLIYDDDCSQDVDCVATLPILHTLEDRGEVKILAMVADSADPFSAPVMRVFAKYAGHPETLIGANQTNDPATALCDVHVSRLTTDESLIRFHFAGEQSESAFGQGEA